LFEKDVFLIDIESSIEARNTVGGTAVSRVKEATVRSQANVIERINKAESQYGKKVIDKINQIKSSTPSA